MLNEWTHWLSSLHPDQIAWLLLPMLLFDAPRYAVAVVGMWGYDVIRGSYDSIRGRGSSRTYEYCPTVSVVIAGLNEGKHVDQTLRSCWGTYPNLDIIVVDDGSTDDMAAVASDFARQHQGVRVLRKPKRGGKSSALNFALAYSDAEIVVGLDADSHIESNTIWEIVQPFQDANVGAVSGTVLARNPFASVAAWLQAFEYLTCIFVGRMLASRLNVLGIVSGALGAFRRTALDRVEGWDVGPGEDGDLTLKMRKAGFKIAFAPYAQCLTKLPTRWTRWINQRRRWNWAVITFECRKHIDLAYVFARNFRWSNFFVMLDRWTYNILFPFFIWIYLIWTLGFNYHEHTWKQYLLYYLIYVAFESVHASIAIYYSSHRRRDFCVGLAAPLMPFYHLFHKLITIIAIVEETLWRRSYEDNFVPAHVRRATWHW